MSDSKLFDEALDALYQAAKASANFVEVSDSSYKNGAGFYEETHNTDR